MEGERPNRFVIAARLRDIAAALDLLGDNRFRAQAYRRGADSLEALSADLDDLVERGRLVDLPGIGAALAAQIAELRRTGRSSTLERLEEKLPPGALALSQVPGLSLKAIEALSAGLGVRTVAELREACEAGRVRTLKGFGEKREKKILAAMDQPVRREEGTRLVDALEVAGALVRHLRGSDRVMAAEPVGEVRRGLEVVRSIEVLGIAQPAFEVIRRATSFGKLAAASERGHALLRGRLADGTALVVHAAEPAARAAALLRHTGSSAYLELIDRAASERGLSVRDDGVFSAADGARLEVADEAALHALLGVPLRAPPSREAEALGDDPAALVQEADIRGVVHCHTDWSDGRHTIAEMAAAADALGYAFMTITDHSPTASYAGGLDLDRIERQWEEIARVQETVRVRLLRGTESDIVRDGALDWPDHILERLDVIVASVHNRYGLDAAETTRRIVRAMRHPCFKIWGHALGRILLRRPPVACDVDAILDAISESRAAIEINGDPYRLDLEPRLARRARARGIPFVVSVDAHSRRELENVGFGVLMAQRAGLRREEVLNTRGAAEFARLVAPTGVARRDAA